MRKRAEIGEHTYHGKTVEKSSASIRGRTRPHRFCCPNSLEVGVSCTDRAVIYVPLHASTCSLSFSTTKHHFHVFAFHFYVFSLTPLRLQVLMSAMLSSQTKDPVTAAALERMREVCSTPCCTVRAPCFCYHACG